MGVLQGKVVSATSWSNRQGVSHSRLSLPPPPTYHCLPHRHYVCDHLLVGVLQGKVVSVSKLVGPKATGETCDVVIQTDGDIPYWEGQSYGVVPPVQNH